MKKKTVTKKFIEDFTTYVVAKSTQFIKITYFEFNSAVEKNGWFDLSDPFAITDFFDWLNGIEWPDRQRKYEGYVGYRTVNPYYISFINGDDTVYHTSAFTIAKDLRHLVMDMRVEQSIKETEISSK